MQIAFFSDFSIDKGRVGQQHRVRGSVSDAELYLQRKKAALRDSAARPDSGKQGQSRSLVPRSSLIRIVARSRFAGPRIQKWGGK